MPQTSAPGEKSLSVGIVTGSMSRNAGGLFNSVRRSAIELSRSEVAIEVYALEDEFSEADRAEWSPLEPNVLPRLGPASLGYAPSLSRRLASGSHDLVHLHGIWQALSLSVSRWKARTGRPTVISPRGMLDRWALGNSRWKKRLAGALFEHRNLRSADCLHALNESEARSMRDFGLDNPIAIIPNGTDLPDIDPVERAPDHAAPRTLLFLGRIHPKKGIRELLDAWQRLRTLAPTAFESWRLTIAGWDDGGYLAQLKAHCSELGLDDRVQFPGPAFGEEKDRLLRSADAFILPSFSEGLPMSVLEGWSYRLPVFMTAHCNLPIGFEAGAAIEITTDPAEMADTLARRLADDNLQDCGVAGRELVETRFSWSEIAVRHREVYDWLCGRNERPDCVLEN